jgi:hypothetical protein
MLAKIKRASLADTKVTLSEHPRKALFQDTHAAVAQAASGHELHKPMLSYLSFSGSQDITAQASTIHPGHFGPPEQPYIVATDIHSAYHLDLADGQLDGKYHGTGIVAPIKPQDQGHRGYKELMNMAEHGSGMYSNTMAVPYYNPQGSVHSYTMGATLPHMHHPMYGPPAHYGWQQVPQY